MKQKEMLNYLNESDIVKLMTIGNKLSHVLDMDLTTAIEKLLEIEIHNGVMRGTYDRKSVKHVIDFTITRPLILIM